MGPPRARNRVRAIIRGYRAEVERPDRLPGGPPVEVYWIAEGKTERRSPAELPELVARRDGLLWVDVPECDEEAQRVLTEVFHFHPLAIRDCTQRCHIPKLHTYADHLLLILHAPEPGPEGRIHLLELDYFASLHYLVTVHGPINPDVPIEKAL